MFKRMAKFAAIRMVAFPLGIALQIFVGLNWPSTMRVVQWISSGLADAIEYPLPDAYAVWVPALNLDSGLVMILFTIVAYICVELVIISVRSIFHRH